MSQTDPHTITLLLKPHLELRGGPERERAHYGMFEAWLGSDRLLVSASPLYDAAEILLEKGADPDTLLTSRHEGKEYPNFVPLSLAVWATRRTAEKKRAAKMGEYTRRYKEQPHLHARDD